jgi:hypothetical protein
MVGDAESRGHMNRLTYLISIYQAQQVCVGSRFNRIAFSERASRAQRLFRCIS